MQIHITEHKSTGSLRPACFDNCVRVFVDRDYHYGYFINEHELFSKLTEQQQAEYLAADSDVKFEVSQVQAQAIIDRGFSPYKVAK